MELLIVNYHYFREESYLGGIYPTSKAAFIHQVKELAKTYRFISQSDLISFLQQGATTHDKYCLLTFDDGLKEQMEAFETLNEMGVPAIFYVPTDPIEKNMVLDVHKLHYIRATMNDRQLYDLLNEQYNLDHFPFDEAALSIQYRYDNPLARKIKYFLNFELNEEQKAVTVQNLFKELASDEAAFSYSLYMDKNDLTTLANAGQLGSHGSSHRPLAKLEAAEARADIHHSVKLLQAWTGHSICSFAYPFGGETAVSPELAHFFEDTEICFALTMRRGTNGVVELANPFFLKRLDTNDAPGSKKPANL